MRKLIIRKKMDVVITKKILDNIYINNFDSEIFKSVDPCGSVYKLMEHTNNQLDIELGALFVSMISWGNRKAIRKTAEYMLCDEMKWSPASFIIEGKFENSYKNAKNNCVYRTLNVETFKKVCRRIQKGLDGYNTMEKCFEGKTTKESISTICSWLSDAKIGTMDKSACKRICMFMRWMTRAVAPDFGLWATRSPRDLYAIMDVHVCNLTRSILTNKRPTWKACEELTNIFKSWDSDDPLKYDIALMVLADNINKINNSQHN